MSIRDFSSSDRWRALVLYGLNTATYKIALAKTLLELAQSPQTAIQWSDLSKRFFNQYRSRLEANGGLPQSGLAGRRTKMERIVAEFRTGQASEADAIERVGNEAFSDVIPRFHNLGKTQELQGTFYEIDFGNQLVLKDELFEIAGDVESLDAEIEARWSLLEGAYTIQAGDFELANSIRDIYIADGYSRRDLTPNIPFLQGYQGNRCFYCAEAISSDVHVDHVLPRQVLQHDEIWNLVLAHGYCNLQKEDRLVGEHYVEKLIARNENIMGSNHPWKKKIAAGLGGSPTQRAKATRSHYSNVCSVLGWNYWGGRADYNPETDPFYSKLITLLNNKDLK
ncbi:HNH endonuclease [bacterium]|nr:HNH endonuclease [bacterium]